MPDELIKRLRARPASRKHIALTDEQIDEHVAMLSETTPQLARMETENSGITQAKMFDVLSDALHIKPKKTGGFPKD